MAVLQKAKMVLRVARALPGVALNRVNADRLLDRRAAKDPQGLAVAYLDERVSWAELRGRADQCARFLASEGVGKGDRVALMIDNRPEFLVLLHALLRIGAVGALINTNSSGAPLAHMVRIAEPKKLIFGSEHADKLPELLKELPGLDAERDVFVQREIAGAPLHGARCLEEGVAHCSRASLAPIPFDGAGHAAYIYTSGTTGLPKAAVISHQRLIAPGVVGGHLLHGVSKGEVIYIPLPLYHSNALMLGWGSALSSGAGVALRRKFSAREFFADVRKYDASSFVYIGELCRYLLQSPVQPGETDHHLRACTGNGMRPDIWEDFQERFAVPIVREIYGATEGTVSLFNLAGVPGMVGRMPPGSLLVRCDLETGEVIRGEGGRCQPAALGETGLLLGRISNVMRFDGYLDKKASEGKIIRDVKKKGDAYFNTGDLLCLHPKSRLSFVDRVGDTFRWKGENVSTNEVAEVVNGAKGVVETNVYGVEVPGCEGRAGMAAIRVEPGFEVAGLADHVRKELSHFQRPLFLRLIEGEIEVTGTFKHQKVKARNEGFDPAIVPDSLYYLSNDGYLPLNAEAFAGIESGAIRPG